MPLYIRNEDVNDLADALAAMTGHKKTEAVRAALAEAIDREKAKPSLTDKIAALQQRVKADGFRRMPDEKAFLDDLSDGL